LASGTPSNCGDGSINCLKNASIEFFSSGSEWRKSFDIHCQSPIDQGNRTQRQRWPVAVSPAGRATITRRFNLKKCIDA
jgi:hypothetical protein